MNDLRLVLFFTCGVSLKTWDDVRTLEEAYHLARERRCRGAREQGCKGVTRIWGEGVKMG
jgi:hypothetical protein